MKLYRIYGNKLHSCEVSKETKCFYFLTERMAAFGFLTRIEKEDALLTPQEAIQAALNNRRTMLGAFVEKAEKAKADIAMLEALQDEYNQANSPDAKTEWRCPVNAPFRFFWR